MTGDAPDLRRGQRRCSYLEPGVGSVGSAPLSVTLQGDSVKITKEYGYVVVLASTAIEDGPMTVTWAGPRDKTDRRSGRKPEVIVRIDLVARGGSDKDHRRTAWGRRCHCRARALRDAQASVQLLLAARTRIRGSCGACATATQNATCESATRDHSRPHGTSVRALPRVPARQALRSRSFGQT
jgi:hypothetical protein